MVLEKYLNSCQILLVNPAFPRQKKSRNHSELLPIGLLKIGAYFNDKGIDVKLIDLFECELPENTDYNPQTIFITSLYTYYSKYVIDACSTMRKLFPKATIVVGGIYASLMPDHCKQSTLCDDVIVGVIEECENIMPMYELVDTDTQIIHTSRGCNRRCGYCGCYYVEKERTFKKTIKHEIIKERVVFYDNNLLANPYIENILNELKWLRIRKKVKYVESQTGFDGRILEKKPKLAKRLKEAGFQNVKIAWDSGLDYFEHIKTQIQILVDAGFRRDRIMVFVLFNHELGYDELEQKRVKLFELGVGIVNCRFRPLDQTYDEYNFRLRVSGQTGDEYFIHPNWSDKEIRQFNSNCSKHNICISFKKEWFSHKMKNKKLDKELHKKLSGMSIEDAKLIVDDLFDPSEFHEVV